MKRVLLGVLLLALASGLKAEVDFNSVSSQIAHGATSENNIGAADFMSAEIEGFDVLPELTFKSSKYVGRWVNLIGTIYDVSPVTKRMKYAKEGDVIVSCVSGNYSAFDGDGFRTAVLDHSEPRIAVVMPKEKIDGYDMEKFARGTCMKFDGTFKGVEVDQVNNLKWLVIVIGVPQAAQEAFAKKRATEAEHAQENSK